ncbi:hypothetical protein OC846_001812 [Tilletia horrida]|uniref:ABC transporter domain-containing protein n=1 Tax=Tilletia horrida TaxID=155126 RepID=A0AAN6GS98_9BASI|nr:hypothetical protein OC846_001812 [Tilletia horrida]KAK0568401.1 hypothetical protein OC861_001958 [Tilletia horrida]
MRGRAVVATGVRSAAAIGTQTLSFFSSSTSVASGSAPLVELTSLSLPGSAPQRTLTWSLSDELSSQSSAQQHGKRTCWAIIASASEPAPIAVKAHVLTSIAGSSSRRDKSIVHSPILRQPGSIRLLNLTNRGPAQIQGAGSGSSSAFVDYSARYGAIRDTDKTTLFESIMETHGIQTGSIARRAFMPDPLGARQGEGEEHGLLQKAADPKVVKAAHRLSERIHTLGPHLNVTQELLQRPLIALSNGQLTRAKILSALLPARADKDPSDSSEPRLELLILDLPFSGLDPPSRARLAKLLTEVNSKRSPRIVLALREGDPVPSELVTNVLWIKQGSTEGDVEVETLERDEYERKFREQQAREGSITRMSDEGTQLPPAYTSAQDLLRSLAEVASLPPSPAGSPEQVRANSRVGQGVGLPNAEPYVHMRSVGIQYKGFHALKSIDLSIRPGTRLILAGPNGSGKTTLLSLMLGDHPLSFSFPSLDSAASPSEPALSLFSHSRSAQRNASPLLHRRIGHTSPELYRAFPRQTDLERGGLSLAQAIGSGFDGVFVRRPLEIGGPRETRVRELVGAFSDLFRGRGDQAQSSGGKGDASLIALLHDTPFATLSPGSQSLALLLRAVVHNPSLLILDEPFAGMDALQTERARVFIDQTLWTSAEERAGKAMVLISHFEQEWPASFGELIRLDEGVVIERVP